jgi:predicted phosphoribosyltransferase
VRRSIARDGRRAGLTVVHEDDGLATGASMLAAARAVATQGPEKTIVPHD